MTRLTSQLGFLLLCVVSTLAAWRPLCETFSLAWRDEQYTHLLIIVPVVVVLILLEWRSVRGQSTPNFRLGAILLLVSLLVTTLAKLSAAWLHSDEQLSVSMFALVMWWIGAFVLCFGTRVSRSLFFPLAFLFLLVPFPLFALNWVVSQLQHGSTFAARLLFQASGVPVAQDDVRLSIPGLTLEVAEECSSIRSSSILLVTTMVLVHLCLRSPWRKALVVGVAIPLSVAKNGLRIFTIAMLGTRVDPAFLTGRLHSQGGVVFFLIALAVISVLLWLLHRKEPRVAGSRHWIP